MVKLASNFERHLVKYEGSTEADYIEFSKRTARKVSISRCDTFICEKFGVYAIAHLPYINSELPDGTDLRNPNEIVEATNNPYDLAKMWVDIEADAMNYEGKEAAIHQYIHFIKKTDFERFGDKNHLSDVSKKWFDDRAVEIDVKVEEVSALTGFDISIDDVIEFVKQWKPGAYQNPFQLLRKRIEERFKEITGFGLKDYYAEHLIASCEYSCQNKKIDVPF